MYFLRIIENIFVKSFTHFFSNLQNSIVHRIHALSKKEFIIFIAFVCIFIFGIIGFLNSVSSSFSVRIPVHGGSLSEGVLGTPRFINPVLANSDVDQSLSKIIYSGLMRKIPTPDGHGYELIPDLAESYSISEDGKTYTFILRDNAVFHDGKSVTVDDIVFTIESIQDTRLQSPQFSNWYGITTQVINESTVQINLPRAFSGFLEATTIGILPAHIWKSFSTDEFLASNRNTLAIGSGPYSVRKITRDKNGIPSSYILKSFKKFTLQKPFLDKIIIQLYPNEETLLSAYDKNMFDILGNIRPREITKDNTKYTLTTPLPRMFGLFLNEEKKSLFKDLIVKNTITQSINKQEIISSVFNSYAHQINHPFPELTQNVTEENTNNIQEIQNALEQAGWKIDSETGIRKKNNIPLSFTISTADTAELKYVAQIIQEQLQKIGIAVEVQVFQLGELENSVIKSRSFDALLFGQFIRNDADIFAFWHSTQKTDPGLNITGYSNKQLDSYIEQLFITINPETRHEILEKINKEIQSAPVTWIYQPDFIYALKKPVYGIQLNSIINKNDRFSNIYQWYTETDTVWNFFNK